MSDPVVAVRAAVDYIAAQQQRDGAIPPSAGGTLDPWNHVECAMALDAGGRAKEAERAYRWLRDAQRDDGSLWAGYRDGQPHDRTKDANRSSYVAVGGWHHYLATGDRAFLRELWPAVDSAVEFALALQAEHGGIYWARDEQDRVWDDCLVAGSSCVRASILCAERIADVLGEPEGERWRSRRLMLEGALRELVEALREHVAQGREWPTAVGHAFVDAQLLLGYGDVTIGLPSEGAEHEAGDGGPSLGQRAQEAGQAR